MKVSLINSLLSKHPYYKKLTNFQKLTVLNIALTKFYETNESEIVHAVYPDGHIGFGDDVIDNDSIRKVFQTIITAKSLSKYSEINANLTDTEFIGEFTDDERLVLYQIALSKVSSLIPEEYSVESMYGDSVLSISAEYNRPIVSYGSYRIIEPDLMKASLNRTLYEYSITGGEKYYSWLNKPTISYENIDIPLITAYANRTSLDYVLQAGTENRYAYLPKTSISYTIRETIIYPHVTESYTSSMPNATITYSLRT